MSADHKDEKQWLRLLGGLALGIYPLLIYLGITSGSPKGTGILMATCAAFLILFRTRHVSRPQLMGASLPFLPALGIGLSAGIVDDERLLLALPALVSLSILVPFAWSLRENSMPMVERLAIIHLQSLNPKDQEHSPDPRHCRRFTWIWSAFLLLNACCAGTLAALSMIDWWLAYACGISYLLIGVLFLAERLLRPKHVGA
jgi:uncharacterized membrane protein